MLDVIGNAVIWKMGLCHQEQAPLGTSSVT